MNTRVRAQSSPLRRKAILAGGGLWIVAAASIVPTSATAQSLDEYDYENLWLRGGGLELFWIFPSKIKSTVGVQGRVDLGFLGPNVRMQTKVGYWSSQLNDEEVERFETQLEDLVNEQNPGSNVTVFLDRIERKSFNFGFDLHWMPDPAAQLRPYLGVGADIYLLNGSGDAIDGTFVEESLDLFTAGVSGVAGLEFEVGDGLMIYGDLRGTLVADVNSFAITAGIGYISP